jgi:hypothetical protein
MTQTEMRCDCLSFYLIRSVRSREVWVRVSAGIVCKAEDRDGQLSTRIARARHTLSRGSVMNADCHEEAGNRPEIWEAEV